MVDKKRKNHKQKLKFVPNVEIADKIKPYFDRGLGAALTSRMEGTANIKTCIKYFRYWREEINDRNIEEVSVRQRHARFHYLEVYDQILYDTFAQKQKFIKAMKDDEEHHSLVNKELLQEKVPIQKMTPYRPDEFFELMFLKVNRFYSDLLMAKGALESAPFIDEETMEATVAEMQKKLVDIKKERKNNG